MVSANDGISYFFVLNTILSKLMTFISYVSGWEKSHQLLVALATNPRIRACHGMPWPRVQVADKLVMLQNKARTEERLVDVGTSGNPKNLGWMMKT